LTRLIQELEAFPNDETLWARAPGVKNSAGNLVLHLEGNLREYVGRQLGGVAYSRARDQEFALAGISRGDLVRRMEEVKELVAKLKRSGRSESALHREVFRPWGSYDSLDNGERFQVKRLSVKPGGVLSSQMHHHRAEHWIVVQGTARVTCGDKTFLLSENESTYIPIGAKHRIENPGKVALHIVEVQSGSYLGEDDIVRFEDNYGRQGTST